MVTYKILITGGAGFIGSHLAHELLNQGHYVIVFDNLDPQVHSYSPQTPPFLDSRVEFIHSDITNASTLQKVLNNVDIVYHLAAKVGVAQSMYKIADFVQNNTTGTSVLLDSLVNKPNNVRKLIIASSMSIYGEGAYWCEDHGIVYPENRSKSKIFFNHKNIWDPVCPICCKSLIPKPTSERAPTNPSTVYAYTKLQQENLCMLIGKTYGIPVSILRFFGTYGSHQALSNPYTGVCAIFATSILARNSPLIYEDGNQSRDLIHVSDICQALQFVMKKQEANYEIFNVGTGTPVSIIEIANAIKRILNIQVDNQILYKFRAGDVRHIFADISKISEKLGFEPKIPFKEGIREFLSWIQSEKSQLYSSISDHAKDALNQLQKSKLV
ncbi:NAD-dependent epimerase/dehydratase family protein [Candidatus Harpocratesius sp.]